MDINLTKPSALRYNIEEWRNGEAPSLSAENLNNVNSHIRNSLSTLNSTIEYAEDILEILENFTLKNVNDLPNGLEEIVIDSKGSTELVTSNSSTDVRRYSLSGRYLCKRGTFDDWGKVPNFIPLRGEIILYYPNTGTLSTTNRLKIKIGDGTTTIANLPFFDGEQGLKGDKGDTPTVKVGKIITLDPNEKAHVENSGNDLNVVLDFSIPAGKPAKFGDIKAESVSDTTTASVAQSTSGDTTDITFKIPRGHTPAIKIGKVTSLNPINLTTVANATVKSTTDGNGDVTFEFGIPQGIKGDKGETGDSLNILGEKSSVSELQNLSGSLGDAYVISGQIYVWTGKQWTVASGSQGEKGDTGATPQLSVGTVTTGNEGTNATVTINGTTEAPKLNFTIPRGNTGAKGDKGNTGNGIESITEIASNADSGINKWTIKQTNGTSQDFSVKNGRGIKSITQINTSEVSGGTNTWRCTLSDDTYSDFKVKNGIGITSITQTKTSTADDGDNEITVTLSNGTISTFNIQNGSKGSQGIQGIQGPKGDQGIQGIQGVGVKSVVQTITSNEDDGNNIITITLTNGNTSTFTIQNGSKGSKGDKGDTAYIEWDEF